LLYENKLKCMYIQYQLLLSFVYMIKGFIEIILSVSKSIHVYGSTEVTFVCFYLSRAHEILCLGKELLSRANEIIKWCARDTMTCARVNKY
jgi:hypothetical protein